MAVCPRCKNAVREWEVAQEVEDLVQPLLQWAATYKLADPVVRIVFPLPA